MQISRGVMSGLTTTPMTQSSTAMAEIKNYILTKGLHPGDALPTESQPVSYTHLTLPTNREV